MKPFTAGNLKGLNMTSGIARPGMYSYSLPGGEGYTWPETTVSGCALCLLTEIIMLQ